MLHDRLQDEDGFQLVELLIAMTILAIGIMAIMAGFSSGMLALARASHTSTGAAIADRQMEACRGLEYAQIGDSAVTDMADGRWACKTRALTRIGPDGRTYWITTAVTWTCPIGAASPPSTSPPSPAPTCGTGDSRAVKLVTISVRDGSDATGKLLVTESSTFDEATG